MTDTLKKYLTTDHSARIQLLRLSQAWQDGLAHQKLPAAVTRLLGELSAACVLLAGNIKFDGSVVLQIQGSGPVSLMVAECTGALDLRATAHLRDTAATLPEDAGLHALVNPDGKGRFTVMLDPSRRGEGASLYQGIVPLEGDSVAHALEYYMKHSEQLDTRLWLAANDRFCTGLLLQRMPSSQHHGGQAAEQHTDDEDRTWEHCTALADTVASQELLDLTTDALMHRLFWQDDLVSFAPQAVRWHCACSRERVANMLRTLGQAEIDGILAEQGHVHIGCNFCGKPYEFDAVDCAALFAEGTQPLQTPGSGLLH